MSKHKLTHTHTHREKEREKRIGDRQKESGLTDAETRVMSRSLRIGTEKRRREAVRHKTSSLRNLTLYTGRNGDDDVVVDVLVVAVVVVAVVEDHQLTN